MQQDVEGHATAATIEAALPVTGAPSTQPRADSSTRLPANTAETLQTLSVTIS
jgi:hypothetical protein